MKHLSYRQTVAIWSKVYNVKTMPLTHYGPCARCGKKGTQRHHKAHDYLFACVMPNLYAKRYLEFHPDDIAILCRKCHINCHKIYDELITAFNSNLALAKGTEKIQQVCETYKSLFLARYLKWQNWRKKK